MARGKKTGGRNFEVGNPGGPGQPKVPEDLREARKLNRLEFERILNKYICMSGPEINNVMKSGTLPVLELIVAKILAKAFNEGDQKRLEFVLDRLIGKVKEIETEKIPDQSSKPELIGHIMTMLFDKK